jgi:hypothetical protein
MAVDTAQRRRSMVSFGDALYGERVPEATNFDSAADRGAEMWLYAGIAPDAGVVVSTAPVNPRVTIRPSIRCTPRIAPSLSVNPTISQ